MPKKVYLVRHGESEDLVKKLHQNDDSALSERGNRQARDVAARFSGIRVDLICTSPYRRTLETAQHISTVTGAPIEKLQILRERKQPSEIVGKPRAAEDVRRVKEIMYEHRNEPTWHYSDEENIFELTARVREFQKDIEMRKENDIVVASHALFIKIFTLLAVFQEQFNPDLFYAFYHHVRTSQTGITMLQFEEKSWKLLTWNDYLHLGEDLAGTDYQ